MPLQIRRGTTAQRFSITPLPGEPIYDTDLQTVFIGDGVTQGGVAAISGITAEDARDAVGQMFVDGVHKNIIFNYGPFQDAANRIDVELDLQNYDGEISASALRGPLFADDSSLIVDSVTKNIIANSIEGDLKGSVFADTSGLLVDAVNNAINLDGTVKGDVIPDQNEQYDIGSNTNRFKDLYLSGTSLYLGSAQITSTGSEINLPAGVLNLGSAQLISVGSAIELPAGSTIAGGANINIVSDDSSSVIVDVSSNSINAISGTFQDFSLPGFTFIDGRLILGNSTDDGSLRITRNSYSSSILQGIFFQQFHEDADAVNMNFLRGRGTSLSPTIVQINDDIADISFWANNGTVTPSNVANLTVRIDQTPTSGQPLSGKFIFSLTDGTSPVVGTKAEILSSGTLRINNLDSFSTGDITLLKPISGELIGSVYSDGSTVMVDATSNQIFSDSVTINQFLQLPIYADDTERSNLIPLPNQGMVIFMQSGAAPAATNQPQYFDGSNWQNL